MSNILKTFNGYLPVLMLAAAASLLAVPMAGQDAFAQANTAEINDIDTSIKDDYKERTSATWIRNFDGTTGGADRVYVLIDKGNAGSYKLMGVLPSRGGDLDTVAGTWNWNGWVRLAGDDSLCVSSERIPGSYDYETRTTTPASYAEPHCVGDDSADAGYLRETITVEDSVTVVVNRHPDNLGSKFIQESTFSDRVVDPIARTASVGDTVSIPLHVWNGDNPGDNDAWVFLRVSQSGNHCPSGQDIKITDRWERYSPEDVFNTTLNINAVPQFGTPGDCEITVHAAHFKPDSTDRRYGVTHTLTVNLTIE